MSGHSTSGAAARLRWLVVVVALMAVLTAGWPLATAFVHNPHPLAAGTRLSVGTSRPGSARFTVGAGWSLLRAGSDPHQVYAFQRGPVRLTISYLALVSTTPEAQLWAGLHTILRLSNPGIGLGRPRPVVTTQGHHGLAGVASGNSMTGTAAIVPGPSGKFAIQVLVLGPPATGLASRGAAIRLVRSLFFSAAR